MGVSPVYDVNAQLYVPHKKNHTLQSQGGYCNSYDVS